MKLEGRVALVTGGARRIGRAVALGLARRGMHVAVHYNASAAQAQALARDLRRAHGVKAEALQAELSDARACARLVEQTVRRLGALDALINNASLYEPSKFGATTEDEWDLHMDVNARAPFFLAQAAAAHLRRRRGHVINLGDWSGHRPYAGYIPYCASKAALLCVNKGLAKALAPEVRVNAILPGPVLLPERDSPARAEAIRQALPLKKLGRPEDVVKAVLYLLDSEFMTGSELVVDGGRLIA